VSNVTCDQCHRYGHVTKECRVQLGAPKSGGMSQVQQNSNQKPRAADRVFVISVTEASQSDSFVRGIYTNKRYYSNFFYVCC